MTIDRPRAQVPLFLIACTAAHADCQQGRTLFEAAQATGDPGKKIALLRQSTATCPDAAAYGELATALLGTGDDAGALDALRAAGEASDDPDQQVQIHALTAHIHLGQHRLPEAIAAIERAVDYAQGPLPEWVVGVRRAIDTHPDRARLDAGQVARSLALRGAASRGFQAVPKIDLYILFDFDKDHPNAAGVAQTEALAKALEGRAADVRERYLIIGHSDSQGTPAYNQRLSERRAQAVRRLMEAHHPALAGRLAIAGRGEAQLKYPGDSEEDHRLNRRVEVQVLGR